MVENAALRRKKENLGKRAQKLNLGLDRWIDLTTVDLSEFRILWFLFYESAHTKTQIVTELNLWEPQAEMILERLRRGGFVYDEYLSFGGRMIRVYHLTELGRFLLYNSNLLNSPAIS